LLRVKCANGTPEFIALSIEKNKSGCKFKTVYRSKFPADWFLNIQANDVKLFANTYPAIKFLFEPVNGGLNLGACNSVRGLELK